MSWKYHKVWPLNVNFLSMIKSDQVIQNKIGVSHTNMK